MNSQTTF